MSNGEQKASCAQNKTNILKIGILPALFAYFKKNKSIGESENNPETKKGTFRLVLIQ